jgi:hypothetical protein
MSRRSFEGRPGPNAGSSTDAKPLNSQLAKVKICNAEAKMKGLSEDARKTFMSSCLKGATSP